MKIIEIILIFAIVVFLFFLSKPFQNTTECLALNPMFPTYDLIVISNSMNSNEIYILPMDPTNTYLFMKNGNTYGSFYVNFQLNMGIPILSIVSDTVKYSILSTSESVSTTAVNNRRATLPLTLALKVGCRDVACCVRVVHTPRSDRSVVGVACPF